MVIEGEGGAVAETDAFTSDGTAGDGKAVCATDRTTVTMTFGASTTPTKTQVVAKLDTDGTTASGGNYNLKTGTSAWAGLTTGGTKAITRQQ